MKRIAVTAAKGGIGKTFISVHLCWIIHYLKYKTGLVDLGSTQPACQFLDRDKYIRNDISTSNFAFTTKDGIVVASCEDWDKVTGYRNEFHDIISNPQHPPKTLNNRKILRNIEVVIYDTDHWLKSLVNFIEKFDTIIILIDNSDFSSLTNLAVVWQQISNSNFGQTRSKIKILSNKSKQPKNAWKKLKKHSIDLFRDRMFKDEDIKKYISEMEESYVFDISIPKYSKSFNANAKSTPIWRYHKSAYKTFEFFAKNILIGG
ncbi:MAG: CobQ/CobB/MinD/ParA nucleotide binding domain protein [Candidatus Scalindua rubra]|uniref:CobQ/CobB/MinD/ParA nucleotide binding domain protein n=1 Tax=Candidatus Scalindua rubra TaxID=1872076 RepID=A0A1E3X752_9BACT|nr:MAG: CobQ/CobB/MinD/ParA nucleotide binding domain protein [Candidatus Scalindua rubra]